MYAAGFCIWRCGAARCGLIGVKVVLRRIGFGALALVTALADAAMLLSLRHVGWTLAPESASWPELRAGLVRVLREPGVAGLIAYQVGATGAAFVLFAGWGASWLRSVYGLGAVEAAQLLTWGAVAYAAGALAWGAVPKHSLGATGTVLVGGLILVVLLALPAAGLLGRPWLPVWLVGFGLVTAGYPLIEDQVRARLPPALLVRAITLLGVGSVGGAGVLLAISGSLIDLFAGAPGEHPPQSFQAMFALLAGVNVLTWLWFGFAMRRASVAAVAR